VVSTRIDIIVSLYKAAMSGDKEMYARGLVVE